MQIQTQPVLSDKEVSEVSSIALVPRSQEAMTSKGESFKTTKTKTWFQTMTDHFEEALG